MTAWPVIVRVGILLVLGGLSACSGGASSEGSKAGGSALVTPSDGRSQSESLLTDGSVLVAGGYSLGGGFQAAAMIYDPVVARWHVTGNLQSPRAGHQATLLQDGSVLVSGGTNGGFLSSTEFYRPAVGQWMKAGNLSMPRIGHTSTLLPNGQVLITSSHDSTLKLWKVY